MTEEAVELLGCGPSCATVALLAADLDPAVAAVTASGFIPSLKSP